MVATAVEVCTGIEVGIVPDTAAVAQRANFLKTPRIQIVRSYNTQLCEIDI